MDSTILTIMGSVASGVASVGISLFGRNIFGRKIMLSRDIANRERLYIQFIEEVSKVYIDSLDGASVSPSALVPLYSLISKMRLVSSEKVLRVAEKVADELIDSCDKPALTMVEIREIPKEQRATPIREFTQACREERQKLLNCL